MATPNPFEMLWKTFLQECATTNGKRAKEDQALSLSKGNEIKNIQQMKEPQRNKMLIEAIGRHNKGDEAFNNQRSLEDATLIRRLFDRAVSLNPYLNQQVAVPVASSTPMFPGALSSPRVPVSSSPHPLVDSPSMVPGENRLRKRARTSVPAGSSSPALSAAMPTGYYVPPANRGRPARPQQLLMSQVGATDFILEYPKNSGKFFVANCVICDRTMETPQGIYAHLTQVDTEHMALFGGDKSFRKAIEICGIPVVDATKERVHQHHNTRDYIKGGGMLYLLCARSTAVANLR
jgi:hypothetical protein